MKCRIIVLVFVMAYVITPSNISAQHLSNQTQSRQKSGQPARKPNDPGVDKIKKKTGQIVDGKINGLVVQRRRGTGRYNVIKGEDIKSIDENGIHLLPSKKFIRLVMPNSQDGDDAGTISFAYSFFSRLGNVCSESGFFGEIGGVSGGCHGAEGLSPTDVLLGTLKEEQNQPIIVQFLEIATATGNITVPVGEIVAFKEKKTVSSVSTLIADSKINLNGDWNLATSTPGKWVSTPLLIFKHNNRRASGSFKVSDSETPFESLSVKARKINFTFKMYRPDGQPIIYSFSGKIKDDTMEGDLTISGTTYRWLATRIR